MGFLKANLNIELAKIKDSIEKKALAQGLDFYQTIFQLLDYSQINKIAAYGGFPVRYKHWSFGMSYRKLSQSYKHGMGKIYELVINNDPCIAYLMRSNSLIDQKMVMAHVYGHADFFKHNQWFSRTQRKMLDEMANHARRVAKYVKKYGFEAVESCIDDAKSIDNLIDVHLPFYNEGISNLSLFKHNEDQVDEDRQVQSKKDVMGYLAHCMDMPDWKKEILLMLREEAYYFAPQMQTKIMNEGWASFWHSKLMTEHVLCDDEIVDFADLHSHTMFNAPGQMNPYKIGIEIFRYLYSQFGKDKIFKVRYADHDYSFIDQYLSMEWCQSAKLFMYADPIYCQKTPYQKQDEDFKQLKKQFLQSLQLRQAPPIVVESHDDTSLCLKHVFEGVELKMAWAKEVLKAIHRFCQKDILLLSENEGGPFKLIYDGENFKQS